VSGWPKTGTYPGPDVRLWEICPDSHSDSSRATDKPEVIPRPPKEAFRNLRADL
jgi:hypothetical protein